MVKILKRVFGVRTIDKHYDMWLNLSNQYADTEVYEVTYRTWKVLWVFPVYRRRIKLVYVPVWLKVRQLTLGY